MKRSFLILTVLLTLTLLGCGQGQIAADGLPMLPDAA